MAQPKISAQDWKAAKPSVWNRLWTSDCFNRVFALDPLTAAPCTSFTPTLVGRALNVAFKSKYLLDSIESPALCIKFASKSSDPSDQVHYVVKPDNFVLLKAFEGYKPLSVDSLNKERAVKAKSSGQWFISVFRSLDHPGYLSSEEAKLPTSLPSKVSTSDALTPLPPPAKPATEQDLEEEDPKKKLPFGDEDDDLDDDEKAQMKKMGLEEDDTSNTATSSSDSDDAGPVKKTVLNMRTGKSKTIQSTLKGTGAVVHRPPVTARAYARKYLFRSWQTKKSLKKRGNWDVSVYARVEAGELADDIGSCSEASEVDGDEDFEAAVTAMANRMICDPSNVAFYDPVKAKALKRSGSTSSSASLTGI